MHLPPFAAMAPIHDEATGPIASGLVPDLAAGACFAGVFSEAADGMVRVVAVAGTPQAGAGGRPVAAPYMASAGAEGHRLSPASEAGAFFFSDRGGIEAPLFTEQSGMPVNSRQAATDTEDAGSSQGDDAPPATDRILEDAAPPLALLGGQGAARNERALVEPSRVPINPTPATRVQGDEKPETIPWQGMEGAPPSSGAARDRLSEISSENGPPGGPSFASAGTRRSPAFAERAPSSNTGPTGESPRISISAGEPSAQGRTELPGGVPGSLRPGEGQKTLRAPGDQIPAIFEVRGKPAPEVAAHTMRDSGAPSVPLPVTAWQREAAGRDRLAGSQGPAESEGVKKPPVVVSRMPASEGLASPRDTLARALVLPAGKSPQVAKVASGEASATDLAAPMERSAGPAPRDPIAASIAPHRGVVVLDGVPSTGPATSADRETAGSLRDPDTLPRFADLSTAPDIRGLSQTSHSHVSGASVSGEAPRNVAAQVAASILVAQDRAFEIRLEPEELGRAMLSQTSHSHVPGASVSGEAPRNVAAQVAASILAAQDRAFEIRLQPEELGRVSLTLSGDTAALNVTLVAERGETLDLMRRHIDVLAEELRKLGYGSVDFTFGDGRSDPHGAYGESSRRPGVSAREEDPEGRPNPERTAPARPADGAGRGMDIRV